MQPRNKSFKSVFSEICQGFSVLNHPIGTFYIKHLNYSDQAELEDLRDLFFNQAKKRGLPTIEDSLNNLEEEGLWTKHKEESLKQEESFVAKLISNKKNIYLKSQLDKINSQIEEASKKINYLKNERNSLLGNTCENHADQKVTEEFLKLSLFKDESLKELFFCDETFDDLDASEISDLVIKYNNLTSSFSDSFLQKLVLEDFFSYYMPFSEDPIHFFGIPVVKMTYNQLRLLIYARYFKNLLQSSEKIPEEYRKDPEKLIDYVNANEKAKNRTDSDDGTASSIVGATKEDYEYLNMNKKDSKTVDLSEEAKKKGGTLNMQDLMKMMGHN